MIPKNVRPQMALFLKDDGYVKSFVVSGEILNSILGEIPLGTTKYLEDKSTGGAIDKHDMRVVILGLIHGGY